MVGVHRTAADRMVSAGRHASPAGGSARAYGCDLVWLRDLGGVRLYRQDTD